jgi:hypothetical protein
MDAKEVAESDSREERIPGGDEPWIGFLITPFERPALSGSGG